MDEEWRTIPEFRDYEICEDGRIYNTRKNIEMKTSLTNHGHVKINLKQSHDSKRKTRSVAKLVAESFVEAPNLLCDEVVMLDGDITNVHASNLAWRPTWFAWKYTRQMKERQPVYFQNLRVMNVTEGLSYDSVMEAGISEGLLFDDIWRSTYTGKPTFPYGSVFEVIERV